MPDPKSSDLPTVSVLPPRELSYEEYLTSEEWRLRRELALAIADHRCQLCNSPAHLQVHHRTYERIGHEDTADLTVLCLTCHDAFHVADLS